MVGFVFDGLLVEIQAGFDVRVQDHDRAFSSEGVRQVLLGVGYLQRAALEPALLDVPEVGPRRAERLTHQLQDTRRLAGLDSALHRFLGILDARGLERRREAALVSQWRELGAFDDVTVCLDAPPRSRQSIVINNIL